MYLFNALDKGNLGNAKTNGFEKDLHFKGNQVRASDVLNVRDASLTPSHSTTFSCMHIEPSVKPEAMLTSAFYRSVFYVPYVLFAFPLSLFAKVCRGSYHYPAL